MSEKMEPLMVKAVWIHETGGPEVLSLDDVELSAPGEGEVTLRHTALGLNYIDIGMREGHYPFVKPPMAVGMEAAGVVEEVGPGVDGFKPGDRVSHCMVPGAHAEKRNIKADRLIRLPGGISDEVAAAATLQGLTAEYLLRSSHVVRPGETVLVQAAAGGVGLMLCQWAKALGATVLGTVGTDEKAALAKAHGCDHPIVYTRENFVDRVNEITGGAGVNAVYDAIGKDTFLDGIKCLAVRGHMVAYGNASGRADPLDLSLLGPKSLTVTWGGLGVYVADPVDRGRRADALWEMITSGKLKIEINQHYALEDIKQAHIDLQGRKTTGSSVITL
jgi:NADPH2:quinone reductase